MVWELFWSSDGERIVGDAAKKKYLATSEDKNPNRKFIDHPFLLGLKNNRERKEELKLWKDIYSQSRRNVRIVNYLKPIIDFDWVFLPSYPHEAIQIIPTFHYYDVKKVKFIGGPSWLSKKLLKERRNLGSMIFVGDDPKDFDPKFKSLYISKNKRNCYCKI